MAAITTLRVGLAVKVRVGSSVRPAIVKVVDLDARKVHVSFT